MRVSRPIISQIFLLLFILAGCQTVSFAASMTLQEVLSMQPQGVKDRYAARHPQETLDFFGIKPGMRVIEALPGRGWYSKILSRYLGPSGYLVGVDYAQPMYPKFNFYDDETIEAKKTWPTTWVSDAVGWHGNKGARFGAFAFGSMTADLDGQVDAVLLIRAMHNLARFENDGGYLSTALGEITRALKPGGIIGVVQHMAPESAPDDWANGSNGYLKKSFVINTLTAAGYELVGESDININPADQPVAGDIVWRLPPSLATSGKDAALREQLSKIGESTRMTLLFRKSR